MSQLSVPAQCPSSQGVEMQACILFLIMKNHARTPKLAGYLLFPRAFLKAADLLVEPLYPPERWKNARYDLDRDMSGSYLDVVSLQHPNLWSPCFRTVGLPVNLAKTGVLVVSF